MENKKTVVAISSLLVLVGIVSVSVMVMGSIRTESDPDKNHSETKAEIKDDASTKESNDEKYYHQGIPVWRPRDDDSISIFLVRKEIDSEDNRITRVKYRLIDGQSNIAKIAELKCGLMKYREVAISDNNGKNMKEKVTDWIWCGHQRHTRMGCF
ncbi:MAG: hypothetical protein KGZ80_13935 [Methylomonas sp.]|nr:hypothetical protein [Methylomonas sp.]